MKVRRVACWQRRRTVAVHVPELRAELGARRALRYGAGSGPASGVASHVRAASGLRRLGSRLFIVQDDVNALAVMDASGRIEPLLMPAGTDGRRSFDDTLGNKHLKMDLEAAVHLPDARLLAFGSGSARTRESIVIVEPGIGLRVRRAPGLYARLREHCEAAGAELNIEGAVIQGHRLRLFQRGNGARDSLCRSGSLVLDVELAQLLRWLDGRGPVPDVVETLEVDLGTIDGVRFGFTDAAATIGGRIAFLRVCGRFSGRARRWTGPRLPVWLAERGRCAGRGRDRGGWACDSTEARRNRASARRTWGVRCRGGHGSTGPTGIAGRTAGQRMTGYDAGCSQV